MPTFVLLLLAALPQADMPPLPDEIQASAALDNAWDARKRVLRALCGETDRERRLRATDAHLAVAQDAYRARFRHPWSTPTDTSVRQWECAFPDGFEWTLASYNNALTAADAALAR